MNSPAPSPSKIGGRAAATANAEEKRDEKFFSENARNTLISLDLGQEIQGNPRKSNGHKAGFSQRNGGEPRKTKRPDRARTMAPPPSTVRYILKQ